MTSLNEDEVAGLLNRLRLAEARADAASTRADAESSRADAASTRADAESSRADAASTRADAERASGNKREFIARLDGIAAGGSEVSPADEFRRGAPSAVSAGEDEVLRNVPLPTEGSAQASWALYLKAHKPVSGRYSEVRSVQPVVARLAHFAAGTAGELRVWLGKVATDDTIAAAVAPDQVWSHVRDAAPSMIGALVVIEVKNPGDIKTAIAQATKYLRRRVAALFHEADSRGETGHDIFALAVATDGCSVVLVRVSSGAPSDGCFTRAWPCPVLTTVAMPLLLGWDFTGVSWVPPSNAPDGFCALVRLLRSPVAALGPGQPLTMLDAMIEGISAPLSFSARLGSGGTSDVYAIAAGSRFEGACVKVPRYATAAVDAQFRREALVLRQLSLLEGATMPRLVCEGERAGSAAVHSARCRWPLLVIAPAGLPLCDYVAELEAKERGVAAMAAAEGGVSLSADAVERRISAARRTLADCALGSILRTLQLAHEHSLVHCDVRPANLVVLDSDVAGGMPQVLLVDWGLCATVGDNVILCGVPAFAPDAVFFQQSLKARASLDLVAAAHSWLAIAFGKDACATPWTTEPLEPALDTIARRSAWLLNAENAHKVAAVAELLSCDARGGGTCCYTWPQQPLAAAAGPAGTRARTPPAQRARLPRAAKDGP